MSDFTIKLKRLINRRDFAQVRQNISELALEEWLAEMKSPEGLEISRNALGNSDVETLSAIFYNPYERAVEGTHAYQEGRLRDSAIGEFMGGFITPKSLVQRQMGGPTPKEAKNLAHMMEWDKKMLQINEATIQALLSQLQNPLEQQDVVAAQQQEEGLQIIQNSELPVNEHDQRLVELATILVGLRNRGAEIASTVWDRVFPFIPSILEGQAWRRSEAPDGLWSGVFLEMAAQDIPDVVEQMLQSLEEDVRKTFVESGVCSWALEDANKYEAFSVAQVIQDTRNELGATPQEQSAETEFENDVTYSGLARIQDILANTPPARIRILLFSEEGMRGFGTAAMNREDRCEVIGALLNALPDEEERAELLITNTEAGVPFIAVAETIVDHQESAAITRVMLDSLSDARQQALILTDEIEGELIGAAALDWMIRNDNVASVHLMFSRLDVEQRRELAGRVDVELVAISAAEIGSIIQAATNGQELPELALEEEDIAIGFESGEESKKEIVGGKRPLSPSSSPQNSDTKRFRGDLDRGPSGSAL